MWISPDVKAFLFLTGNSCSCDSGIRGTVHFLPYTVSLVSPGAERLCKWKPFGLIDQILPTNASGESGREAVFAIFKTKQFEAFLLWVLVSSESQGLLISIMPPSVLSFVVGCGTEGQIFHRRWVDILAPWSLSLHLENILLWRISLENIGPWFTGFS